MQKGGRNLESPYVFVSIRRKKAREHVIPLPFLFSQHNAFKKRNRDDDRGQRSKR